MSRLHDNIRTGEKITVADYEADLLERYLVSDADSEAVLREFRKTLGYNLDVLAVHFHNLKIEAIRGVKEFFGHE